MMLALLANGLVMTAYARIGEGVVAVGMSACVDDCVCKGPLIGARKTLVEFIEADSLDKDNESN